MALGTRYAVAGVLVVAVGVGGSWWMTSLKDRQATSAPPPQPTSPDLNAIDPAIAELVSGALAEAVADQDDASRWMHLGVIYDANNLTESARQCYEYVVWLEPAQERCWYHLAVVRAELGDLDGAIEAMQRASDLDRSYAPAHWRMGLWLLDRGDLEEAETAFNEATRVDPDDSAGWIGLGRVYLQRGEHDEAIEVLRRVAASSTHNAGYAHHLLASAYRELGRHEEAEAVAIRSTGTGNLVLIDPWRHQVQGLRAGHKARIDEATSMFGQQKYAEAADLFERLHAERPDDVVVLINLAMTYRVLREVDKAIEVCQDALSLSPDHYAVHFELARAYAEKSRQSADARRLYEDLAIEHAERASALNPTYADSHALRGLLLLARQDFSGAAELFHLAARFEPENPQHLYYAALAHCQMSQWHDAIQLLEGAIRLDPNQGDCSYLIGVAQMNLGHLDEAETALKRASELMPANAALDQAFEQLREEKARAMRGD